jgi:hypothetical protein
MDKHMSCKPCISKHYRGHQQEYGELAAWRDRVLGLFIQTLTAARNDVFVRAVGDALVAQRGARVPVCQFVPACLIRPLIVSFYARWDLQSVHKQLTCMQL